MLLCGVVVVAKMRRRMSRSWPISGLAAVTYLHVYTWRFVPNSQNKTTTHHRDHQE